MSRVPPLARLVSLLIFVVATFINVRIVPLAIITALFIPLTAYEKLAGKFLKFLLIIQLPMTVMLIGMWGWVVGAPPDQPMHSDPHGGAAYALLISLRLAVLGGAFQLIMLSIPPKFLPATMRGWGLRGEGLVVALGVFAVEPELRLRAEQVLVARRARGMLGGSRWAGMKQTPYLLRPLFVWSIRSAIHRSEVWEQRAMLLRVQQLHSEADPFSPVAGIISIALSVIWLIAAIILHWPGLVGMK